MNSNIVQNITSQLDGGTNIKLSSLLGEPPDRTQNATNVTVPTLLAGLTHLAASSDGARRLVTELNQQDMDVADHFDPTIGTTTDGAIALDNLFDGTMASKISSVLGRYTGINTAAASALLATITPLVLGFIGKQQRSMGLDGAELASMLNDQKQNIVSAIPSGLAKMLGSVPGFGGLTQKLPTEELAHAGAAPSFVGTSQGYGQSPPALPPASRPQISPMRVIAPLIVLTLIIWAWLALSHHETPTSEEATTTLQNQPSPAVGVAQISDGLRNTLALATTALSGISDASSADKISPQIKEWNTQLSSLRTQLDTLPASARANALNAEQVTVVKARQLCAKVRAMPGMPVGLQSTIDRLGANLASLSTTSTTINP